MHTKKRNMFEELMEGVDAMRAHREGRVTLRTHRIEARPRLIVSPKFFVEAREELRMSRPTFARWLCIPERTLERWEQGRSKPNQEAILLVELVKEDPTLLQRIPKAHAKAAAAGSR